MAGLPAALWLLGLYAAAPALRAGRRYEIADRLRDALVLGVAIPFALGFVHGLYWGACWAALLFCVAIAVWRGPGERERSREGATRPPYLAIAALLLVAWPQLMRPLLDGDSLSYHLPNAAAWAQAHSLWTATTRYWWYPPGSELFACALYVVGSPFALPWCGFCALAVLGFRIVAWSQGALGASPALADALAAATISAYPLAIQGGTLQNDVWLAAFWLETLWSLRAMPANRFAPSAAVTALLKPQGWILAAFALLASRARPILWLGTFSALGLWVIHDAALWNGAIASPASSMTYDSGFYGSTILAHGIGAFALLASVLLRFSPFALIALVAALFGPPLATRDRALGWAAFAAVALFLVLPFGYETGVPQLATGASLRFAAPAIAVGALLLGPVARRFAAIAVPLLWISTVYGCWFVLAIFWNDGSTHVALAVAALGVAVAATANLPRLRLVAALAFLAGVVLATHLAARHPLDYYDDSLSVGGTSPGVYRWIERAQPAAIGGWGLRAGVVNVLSPRTRTLDLSDSAPCAQARRNSALLIAVAQNDLPSETNARRLSEARACGRTLFNDGIAVITKP